MPGYKAIPFRDGKFYLLDLYSKTKDSAKSTGTTTIWHDDNPIWIMHYGGFYKEEAIGFLQRALAEAYITNRFIGGRGPSLFEDDQFRYENTSVTNDFSRFRGREDVLKKQSSEVMGYHEYWGMSLV